MTLIPKAAGTPPEGYDLQPFRSMKKSDVRPVIRNFSTTFSGNSIGHWFNKLIN